jgi:FtsP/CotA-like multicopper oxidase with cupredoxin domain
MMEPFYLGLHVMLCACCNLVLQVIMVNGKFPADSITANVGDRLILTTINRMDEPISIHSHGMLQRQSVAMDGQVAGTQRPIAPGGEAS